MLVAGGCSPLTMAVKQAAPGFVVKQPALDNAELGRRRYDGQAVTNDCFVGTQDTTPYTSWASQTLSYSAGGGAQLQGDFGKTITVGASASGNRSVNVTLSGMSVAKLTALYFNAGSACATDAVSRQRYSQPGGAVDAVVTRALQATNISITAASTVNVALNVKADALPVNGGANANGQSTSSWQGANLFIASFIEKFKVTLRNAPACKISVGTGQTCNFDPCSFQIDSAGSDGSFAGTLSCQGGATYPVASKPGTWQGVNTQPGVSYSLRASVTEQVGIFAIDLLRWDVLSL